MASASWNKYSLNMAPKIFKFLGALVLLAVMTLNLVQAKPDRNSFKSIQSLVGSQRGQSVNGLHLVKQHFQKLGYLDNHLPSTKNLKHDNDDFFDEALESAVRIYQQKFHLDVTGRLDDRTVKQILKPRCGVPDFFNGTKHFHGIVADYTFFPGAPRWSKKHLTYKFVTGSVEGAENVKSVVSSAFDKWAQVSDFSFEQVSSSSNSDIQIGFYSYDHGDGHPFDGPLGIYAHAFPPEIGKLHYDADENWSSQPESVEVDLVSVTIHEIGHILGLGHSKDHKEAVMYPYLQPGETKRTLQQDDIQGIQALYK